MDSRNDKSFCDPQKAKYWLPVDLYVGGAEHAVLHLLYSRFWHKVLYDRGHVPTPEPFQRLVNQGMILGEMEFTVGDRKVSEDEVEKKGDGFVLKADPAVRVDARAFKMSKARGNVINPDDVVAEYGADSLRLYEMFMGPFARLLAEELWQALGHKGTVAYEQWPEYDPALTKADEIEVPVQVNGKLRARITVPAETDEAGLKSAALADQRVRDAMAGKEPRQGLLLPGKPAHNVLLGALPFDKPA